MEAGSEFAWLEGVRSVSWRKKGGSSLPGMFCEERERLRAAFVEAVRHITDLQAQQAEAVVSHDSDFERFDDLIHVARIVKDHAKYELLAHLGEHRCHGQLPRTEDE